jgi:hypothetical protein
MGFIAGYTFAVVDLAASTVPDDQARTIWRNELCMSCRRQYILAHEHCVCCLLPAACAVLLQGQGA